MSNEKVFSGVGHGGADAGAVSNGMKESDVNLVMANACHEVLIDHGVDNPMSRYKDENDELCEEIREANNSNAKIAVDFHNNAGGGDGFEAYYSNGDSEGLRLCKCIEEQIKSLGQNSRGCKTKIGDGGKDYFGFIRETNMTAIIIESFFLDSSDRDIADTVEEQKKFGVAIAKGILNFLGIEYKEKEPEKFGWIQNSVGWWFKFNDGSYPYDSWQYLTDGWYRFDSNGYALHDTFFIDKDGKCYYLDSYCRMIKDADLHANVSGSITIK